MDPARLLVSLTLVFAIAGIGGALRACGTVARSSSRAVTVPRVLPRVTAYPRVTTSAGRWASTASPSRRGAALGAGAGVAGEDAARAAGGAGRVTKARGGVIKEVGGNADGLIGGFDDDEDDRPLPRQRRR